MRRVEVIPRTTYTTYTQKQRCQCRSTKCCLASHHLHLGLHLPLRHLPRPAQLWPPPRPPFKLPPFCAKILSLRAPRAVYLIKIIGLTMPFLNLFSTHKLNVYTKLRLLSFDLDKTSSSPITTKKMSSLTVWPPKCN